MTSSGKPRMQSLFGGAAGGGFFDLPRTTPDDTEAAHAVVIGAPAATPYPSVGNYCAGAPDAIRAACGWPGVLGHYDFDVADSLLPAGAQVFDWGNLDYSETDFAANRDAIRQTVVRALDLGAVPLVLGGDDSVPIPVLDAFAEHGPLTILQLDAHIDWRDEVGGERLGLSSNMRRASEMPWIERIVQVGARGIGSARPQDHADALTWGVDFFPLRRLRRDGFAPVIDSIPANANLYVALDIDVMDPAIVPAVIGPAPGGLDYWQVVELLEATCARTRLVGFNLVELMPANDIGGRGALVAARFVALMLALVTRQRVSG